MSDLRDVEICRLQEEGRCLRAKVERLTTAIRSTTSSSFYDEMAIRRAVSFELAEIIADEVRALEPNRNPPAGEQLGGAAPVDSGAREAGPLTTAELNLLRNWYNALVDVMPSYLSYDDHELMMKIAAWLK